MLEVERGGGVLENGGVFEVVTESAAETEALGEAWGRAAVRGLVIGLTGDLGAGKTQLVRGLARGLGYEGRVHSPTYTLVNVYVGGRLTLFHLDLYRLETPDHVTSAGLDDYLAPDGVTVIEWVERRFGDAGGKTPSTGFPTNYLHVNIETTGEAQRRISYSRRLAQQG